MLFMVLESFEPPRGAGLAVIAERFRAKGRMLPEGVQYISSWVETSGERCFQLMEAPDRAALDRWIANWSDIGGFEVSEVLTSADFWARRA